MLRTFSIRTRLTCALSLVAMASTCAAAGVSGAVFTTTVNGSAVNANQYESKCAVYLDGGPGPHAPAKAAGLPDGNYYFQVTDANGAQLLSTDPVSNRQFHVSGGIITAYIGTGGTPHPTGFDQDHLAQGAITIGLANGNCPNDYLSSPSFGEVYKVWVTPVASFSGNPANVDNPCSGSCSHGFVHSQSKTDNFKVQSGSSATFCLTIEKKLSNAGVLSLAEGWPMTVLDPFGSQVGGITVTGTNGDTATVCQLGPGTYTVTEGLGPLPAGYVVFGTQVFLNGTPGTTGVSMTFTWDGTQPANITVLFVNAIGLIG